MADLYIYICRSYVFVSYVSLRRCRGSSAIEVCVVYFGRFNTAASSPAMSTRTKITLIIQNESGGDSVVVQRVPLGIVPTKYGG